MTILLLGDGDLAEEVRTALTALDATVTRLKHPTQREVEEVFERGGIERAVVVFEEDAVALRTALMVRDVDADVELLLTYFDSTTADELCERIGHCRITSLAEIVAPVLAASCLDEDLGALRREGDRLIGLSTDGTSVDECEVDVPHPRRARAAASALLRPYDRSAALLLYGAVGIVAVLLLETVAAAVVLDQGIIDAFYGAAKTLVTVDPNDKVSDGPSWFKVAVSIMMLVALVFEAFFTAGIVNRLIDRRLTGLFGANRVPREDHVVVVGLGQVGLRLSLLLRDCGVAVVCVDDREEGENVGVAREAGLPVVIGRGGDPSVLSRLALGRAQAVAAVTNDDLQNLSVAMTVLSLESELRVVVRVGDGRLANETRSLFKLGLTRDVHRIAAAMIAAQATGSDVERVISHAERTYLQRPDGTVEEASISAAT